MQLLGSGTIGAGVLAARGNLPGPLISLVDQRKQALPLLPEGDVVLAAAGEDTPGVIPVEELPVRRAPVVVPEAMFLDDGQAQGLEPGDRWYLYPELTCDGMGNLHLGFRRDVHPVAHQATLAAGEKIDKEERALLGKLPRRLHVEGEIGVSKRQVRNQVARRLLEGRRRDEHHQAGLPGETIDELAVGGGKFIDSPRSSQ